MPLSQQLRDALKEYIVGYGETHKIQPGKRHGSFTLAYVGDDSVSSFKVKTSDGKQVVIMVRGGSVATGRAGRAEILVPGSREPRSLSVKQALWLKDQIPLYKKSELRDLISGRIGDRRRTEDLDAAFEVELFERARIDLGGKPVLKGEEYILRHRRKGDWVGSGASMEKGKMPLTMKRGLAKTWSGRDLLGTSFNWGSEYQAVRLKGED